ncbi:putative chromosome segregation protein SMC [Mycobacterium xenopi 4042]|uniref:Putative chromosome segregation protein SMC n=1 Tax=Mycobacterium xenopi 4042 TaxID=1299334 RepID=X8E8E3_MYCXE|nr:putative chromosome segregation protein SMC [Mycobacterium xenopi 4042]
MFAALFPGGEGRLRLTDPDDMLTTGIEVEARPPGKKVKRLSLLSGGEKALTAVAMLVAIFRPGRRRSTSWTRWRRPWTT